MLVVGLVQLAEQRRLLRLRGLAAEHAVQVDRRVLGRERLLQGLDRGHAGHSASRWCDGRAHAGEQPRELAALRAQGQPVEGVVQLLLADREGRDGLVAVARARRTARGRPTSTARAGTASTRVASCVWCRATRDPIVERVAGKRLSVAVTASRTARISASAVVATATSGVSPAGESGARVPGLSSLLHPATEQERGAADEPGEHRATAHPARRRSSPEAGRSRRPPGNRRGWDRASPAALRELLHALG